MQDHCGAEAYFHVIYLVYGEGAGLRDGSSSSVASTFLIQAPDDRDGSPWRDSDSPTGLPRLAAC